MKIIFAGTPSFSVPALEALTNAGHEIVLVLTQPDRPAGRGMKTTASAVKLFSQRHKLALLQPHSLKLPELHAQLDAVGADINTASVPLLASISGLNESVANQIVQYREAHGRFKTRDTIKKVPRLGEKTFEQAA